MKNASGVVTGVRPEPPSSSWGWDGGMEVLGVETESAFLSLPCTAELRIEAHRTLLLIESGGNRWTTVLHGVGEVAFGAAVQGHLLRRYRLLVDLHGVRELMARIGSTAPGGPARWDEISGVDPVTGEPRKEILSSSEVFRAIRGLLGYAADFVRDEFGGASPDAGEVRLSGPAALWRGFARSLSHVLGRPVAETGTGTRVRRRAG